jgi:hypothetical protein
MPQNIHLFETRNVNYLKPYIDKAKSLGFNVTHTNNVNLENNKLFKEFISVYKHYSVNPAEFEIACFARYFAIASRLKNNDPFLLTDTDVYITKAFKHLQGVDFKGTFVGSEGFDRSGSQLQISPHCTVWNRDLLMGFIHFLIATYKQNAGSDFLEAHYNAQTEKFGRTSISDMYLIYLWIQHNKVPYINSNSANFPLGIDHNISEWICEHGEFQSYENRKYIKINNDGVACFLQSGKKQDMALLHFQGAYKGILKDVYLGIFLKFKYFTLRRNNNGKLRPLLKILK